MFIFFATIFLASIINAFIHGWELTLVIMSAMPVLIIGNRLSFSLKGPSHEIQMLTLVIMSAMPVLIIGNRLFQ
jgi:hypothetical protein